MAERRRLYWKGNAAKSRSIDEILEGLPQGRRACVFDYGCGDGGDWPAILADFPNIDLFAYDPNPASSAVARQRLAALGATVVAPNALSTLRLQADVIVSFSVFEHVYDRAGYLQTAKGLLSAGGSFYLNYDDGHFRVSFDIDEASMWPIELRRLAHNLVAPILPTLGRTGDFQARVFRREVDALTAQAGLACQSSFYSNIESLKRLYRSIPDDRREEFCHLWISTEKALNERFVKDGPLLRGDCVNLWQQMGSRTMVLVHAASRAS